MKQQEKSFMGQFQAARQEVALLRSWMGESAKVAILTFPTPRTSDETMNTATAVKRKDPLMTILDIKAVKDEAAKEIAKERADKAKNAIVRKLREIEAAEAVVRGLRLQLADLEAQIADGTF